MNSRRIISLLSAFSFCMSFPLAQAATIDSDGREVDIEAIREWINTKRQVTVKEIGGNLSLSGEVRAKYRATGETIDGVSQRGSGTTNPTNEFNVIAKVMLDYRSDRTWSAIRLEFNNTAGMISGTANKIKLSRAYFGARAIDGNNGYLDFEMGRRKLGNVFESVVQFDSLFDGILCRYNYDIDHVGNYYLHAGVFVIDANKNQFGYVGETGIMGIADTGLYARISWIDWDTKKWSDPNMRDNYNFIVSQLTLGYKFYIERIQKQVSFYAAGLNNFRARANDLTRGKRANWGAYVGMNMGELKKAGNWVFDINYQWLSAQCVPNFDVAGIGLGNANKTGFYTADEDGTGNRNTPETVGGNVNYQGLAVALDYLITNNINLHQQWQFSFSLDRDIGPARRFKQYEMEFIYGF